MVQLRKNVGSPLLSRHDSSMSSPERPVKPYAMAFRFQQEKTGRGKARRFLELPQDTAITHHCSAPSHGHRETSKGSPLVVNVATATLHENNA